MTELSPLNPSRKVEAASDSLLAFDINEHVATIIRNLKVLHDDGDFVDVTLTAEDSQSCIFHGVLLRAYNPSKVQSVGDYNVYVTADILKLLHAHVYRCSSDTIPKYDIVRIGDEFGIDVLADDLQTISDNLVDLWNNESLTDIELETSDGVFFACHACILAASSPVFADKIERPNGFDRFILDVDFDSDIALKILSFVYTAEVEIDDQTVGDLFMAACTYQYPSLVDACSDYIMNRITIDNAAEVLVLSNKGKTFGDYPEMHLFSQSFKFVVDNFSHVSKTIAFLEVEGTILLKIISDDNIAVGSEEEILDAVLRWFAYAPERGWDEVDDLFEKIYFENISLERLQHYQEMYAEFPKCTDRLKREISNVKNGITQNTSFPNEDNAYYPPGICEPYEMPSNDGRPTVPANDLYGVDDQLTAYETPTNLHQPPEVGNIDNSPEITRKSTPRRYKDPGPRTKNGSLDMRFNVNKLAKAKEEVGNVCDTPKNKNGLPDMRFTANKSARVLSKSGKPDMRNDIKKELVNDSRSVHAPSKGPKLTKSGKPDMRFKENKVGAPQLLSTHETPSMGLRLKADGTPDMRYKDNKVLKRLDFGNNGVADVPQHEKQKTTTGPLKKDGSPDRRYSANRTAVASSASNNGSHCISENGSDDFGFSDLMSSINRSSHITTNSSRCGPLKKDGTPDMRYNANKANSDRRINDLESVSSRSSYTSCSSTVSNGTIGPLKNDGTPDMRYKVNKEAYGSGGYGGSSLSGGPSYRSNYARGPLKKDGTPDMRYKVNKENFGSGGYGVSNLSGASSHRSSNACGRLKKDGTPDMRYKANRR